MLPVFLPFDAAAAAVVSYRFCMVHFLALTQVFHTCQTFRNLDVRRQNGSNSYVNQRVMDLSTKQITKHLNERLAP